MSQEVHVIAIMTPKPEKLERFREAIRGMVQTVHSKEENTIRYMMTEQVGVKDGDTTKVVMVET